MRFCCPLRLIFQLTASRRGWPLGFVSSVVLRDISTHSLTKRLTSSDIADSPISPFQLTASRRGWHPCYNNIVYVILYFNSQPHEEADSTNRSYWCIVHISTHSLTKRLTMFCAIVNPILVFQLTASRRGWRHRNVLSAYNFYFNSQPHEEADCSPPVHAATPFVFQLTASRRGWQQFCTKIPSPKLFFCNYYIYCFLCSSLIQFFAYFFFLNLSFFRCECSRESCVLNFRTYNIKVSVTSKPGLAPICSTLFLYFSPK